MPDIGKLPYDPASPTSIEKYAKRLLHKSLREVIDTTDLTQYAGTGSFGNLIEDAYFHYKPNSKSEPDFPEAGVELKTNPIKKIKDGFSSKERLVFNIIDFEKEYLLTFEESSFWKKNSLILLMMYLHEKGKENLDYIFAFIELWPFPEEDLAIMKQDWQKIIEKIKAGKAHELSEGDTLYLGACTKGANKNSLRKQPFSEIMAMQRAYSLKSKYLNFIIKDNELHKKFHNVIKDSAILKKQTFEDHIIEKLSAEYGQSESSLQKKYGLENVSAKQKLYLLATAILGIKDGKVAEFEKADIEVKTIRLKESGALEQSMSFDQIQYKEIVQEEWEDSYWHETVHKRFLFIVFQFKGKELYFKKAMFWNMPYEDILLAERFWENTKDKIKADVYNDFWKLKHRKVFHVRPKGVKLKKSGKLDLMETPAGGQQTKKCYWINALYIKDVIKD